MIDRLEMIKERLQRIYDLALTSDNEKHFFLWLYDYVRVFDRQDEMKGFFEVVGQDRENDFGRIHELEPLAIKEIDKVYKQVAKYVKEKKIEHPVIKKELGEYEMAKKGDYSSSRGHVEDLYDKLSYSLMTMVEDGTVEDLKFAQGFGVVSDDRRITEWTFSPSYTEYDMLKEGLKNIQETRLWYSWDKITLAFKTIDDLKHDVVRELLSTGKHFEAINWSGLRSEMMEVISGKQNPSQRPYEYIKKDYAYYLAKVHTNSIDFVQNNPSGPKQRIVSQSVEASATPLEVKWSISKDKYRLWLTINRTKTSFDVGTPYEVILSALVGETDEDFVTTDILYAKITGNDALQKMTNEKKKAVWQKCYDLVGKIASEYLVPRFLIYDFNTVRFNEAYKRIS